MSYNICGSQLHADTHPGFPQNCGGEHAASDHCRLLEYRYMSCWAEATLATSRPQNSRAVSTGGVLVSPGKQETAGNKSRDPRMAGQQACWAGQTDLDRGFQGCHPRDPLWMSNLLCRAIATGKCAHNQQPLGSCGWPGGRERGQCVCVCVYPS